YMLIEGDSEVCSPNLVGIKRSGMREKAKAQIKSIYKLVYRSGLNVSHALDEITKVGGLTDEARHMVEFIKSSERGICKHRKMVL
ncbi:MAG: acyl-ACP--UDP-N-acetylglucosamine O-acyltransferase, partial [Candidatus Omnitrophota bacterium]|nr:acyl-ACP--UDP-N-acetylglucosamine O-acyltransferase [Candidatus Omnitrophota bacterium]